jgi:hypothetical protein
MRTNEKRKERKTKQKNDRKGWRKCVIYAITGIEQNIVLYTLSFVRRLQSNHNVRRLLGWYNAAKHLNKDWHPTALYTQFAPFAPVFRIIVLFPQFSWDNNVAVLLSADSTPSGVPTVQHGETDSRMFKYSGIEEKDERMDVKKKEKRRRRRKARRTRVAGRHIRLHSLKHIRTNTTTWIPGTIYLGAIFKQRDFIQCTTPSLRCMCTARAMISTDNKKTYESLGP